MTVRKARKDDAAAIASIYRPYVEKTAISFECTAPDEEEMARRMEGMTACVVAEEGSHILGYAYAHPFSSRTAYRRSAEVTIYIDENERGKGIGQELYRSLEECLAGSPVHNLYAVVAVPDQGSIGFHRRMGYREAGRLSDCGEKFGRLWSVVYMEKRI